MDVSDFSNSDTDENEENIEDEVSYYTEDISDSEMELYSSTDSGIAI